MIEAGIATNASDYDKRTALHLAACENNVTAVIPLQIFDIVWLMACSGLDFGVIPNSMCLSQGHPELSERTVATTCATQAV